jgi:hypothetical protein
VTIRKQSQPIEEATNLIEIECAACGSKHFAPTRCDYCGEVFRPVKRTQRYCRDECRKDFWLARYHARKKVAPPMNGFVRRI